VRTLKQLLLRDMSDAGSYAGISASDCPIVSSWIYFPVSMDLMNQNNCTTVKNSFVTTRFIALVAAVVEVTID
jgi:hypothetical protein